MGMFGDVARLYRRRERAIINFEFASQPFIISCLLGVTVLDHDVLLFIMSICMLKNSCMTLIFPEMLLTLVDEGNKANFEQICVCC
jgi:hypothetical protein